MIGYIYVIRSKQTTDVYYGSTKQSLEKRLSAHKAQYKAHIRDGSQNYIASHEILKYADAYIELVEEFEYEEKKQLTDREAYHIKNNPCINKNIPGQTWQERWEKNKEHNVAKHKEWLQNHKEELKEKRKVYEAENKDKIRADFKEWADKNKEKRKAYMEKWRKDNPDKVKASQEKRKNKISE